MRNLSLVITMVIGLLGLALIVRGAWGGVWPLSVQLIAGVLLVFYAAVRLYSLWPTGRAARDDRRTSRGPRGRARG